MKELTESKRSTALAVLLTMAVLVPTAARAAGQAGDFVGILVRDTAGLVLVSTVPGRTEGRDRVLVFDDDALRRQAEGLAGKHCVVTGTASTRYIETYPPRMQYEVRVASIRPAGAETTTKASSTHPGVSVTDGQVGDALDVFRGALKTHADARVIAAALDVLAANGSLQKAMAAALRVLLPNPDRWFVNYAVAAFRNELMFIDENLQPCTVLSRTNAVRPGIEAVIDHLVNSGFVADGFEPPVVDGTLAWGPDGSIEIFRDAEGRTQFKGRFGGSQVASTADGMTGAVQIFTRVPYAHDEWGDVLVFQDEKLGHTMYLFNDYGIGDPLAFTSEMRTRWLNANSGCRVKTEQGDVMPTAVVLRRGGTFDIVAASPKHVEFR